MKTWKILLFGTMLFPYACDNLGSRGNPGSGEKSGGE